jgi:hypothetical protein
MGIDTRALHEAAGRIAAIQSTSKWGVADEVAAAVAAGDDVEAALEYLVAQVEAAGGSLTVSKARWYHEVGTAWPSKERHGISITAADEMLRGDRNLAPAERFAIARTHGATLTKRKARELAGGKLDYALGRNSSTSVRAAAVARETSRDPNLIDALLDDSKFREQLADAQSKRDMARGRPGGGRRENDEADAIEKLISVLGSSRRTLAKALQAASSVEGVAPIAVDRINRETQGLTDVLEWVTAAFSGSKPYDLDAALQQLVKETKE